MHGREEVATYLLGLFDINLEVRDEDREDSSAPRRRGGPPAGGEAFLGHGADPAAVDNGGNSGAGEVSGQPQCLPRVPCGVPPKPPPAT